MVMPFAITVCPRTLTSPEGREFGGKILALGPFFCLSWGHTNHNVQLTHALALGQSTLSDEEGVI